MNVSITPGDIVVIVFAIAAVAVGIWMLHVIHQAGRTENALDNEELKNAHLEAEMQTKSKSNADLDADLDRALGSALADPGSQPGKGPAPSGH